MAYITFSVIVSLWVISSSAPQIPIDQSTTAEPPLPVIDHEACPFEGCSFGAWIVTKDIELYTTWEEDRKHVATVKIGEVVTGRTGVHITYEPDRVEVLQAIPELQLQPGDILLRYMYRGEGFSDIWAKGQWRKGYDSTFIAESNDSGCLRDCVAKVLSEGRRDWWVQVRTSSGLIGWTKAEGQFDCMDSLGGDEKCYDLSASAARAEAEANLRTPTGKSYYQQFNDEFSEKYANTIHLCAESSGNKLEDFWILLKVKNDDGRAQEVLLQPITKLGECMREILYRDSFPMPPESAYWVGVHVESPN